MNWKLFLSKLFKSNEKVFILNGLLSLSDLGLKIYDVVSIFGKSFEFLFIFLLFELLKLLIFEEKILVSDLYEEFDFFFRDKKLFFEVKNLSIFFLNNLNLYIL